MVQETNVKKLRKRENKRTNFNLGPRTRELDHMHLKCLPYQPFTVAQAALAWCVADKSALNTLKLLEAADLVEVCGENLWRKVTR